MNSPSDSIVKCAITTAHRSPCRSKRGVVVFDPFTWARYGYGFNGPPVSLPCPGRDICAGNCGQRSVHAETRALRDVLQSVQCWNRGPWDMLHVELGADGGVVACRGPSCWQCAREILDVGFVGGVWLYEFGVPPEELDDAARRGIAVQMRAFWHRYTDVEFYRVTLENCGMKI